MYQDVFEGKFLQATNLLYLSEGQKFMGEVDVPNYLLRVEKRLKEESDRLLHYIEPGTKRPLITCVENQLITKHISNILNKGFDYLMDMNSLEHLTLMYSLFSRVKDGQDNLCEYFGAYVKVWWCTCQNCEGIHVRGFLYIKRNENVLKLTCSPSERRIYYMLFRCL